MKFDPGRYHPHRIIAGIRRRFLNFLRRCHGDIAHRGILFTSNDKKIASLKSRHTGEIGYIIGNGPSVRINDLEKLVGKVTFVANRFHLAYDMTSFRPMYTVSADQQVVEDFGIDIVSKSESLVFFALPQRPNIPGDYIWLNLCVRKTFAFSENIFHYVMAGGGSLISAIQIGYFMGIHQFFLYGVDHDFKFKMIENPVDDHHRAIGDDNHFIKNYRSGKLWSPPQTEAIEESFKICDNFLRSKGGWIKNATRGGKLEVLGRVDFDEIIDING